jgi:tRNA A37 threonylcarbamoyladenosine biosynthesis protein TsaE
VDLYRLDDAREVEDLGLEEMASDGVLALEWADKLPRPIPGAIAVHIEYRDGDGRVISIESYSDR